MQGGVFESFLCNPKESANTDRFARLISYIQLQTLKENNNNEKQEFNQIASSGATQVVLNNKGFMNTF